MNAVCTFAQKVLWFHDNVMPRRAEHSRGATTGGESDGG